MEECRVLEVRTLDDGINWASLLAEATEDAFGHIDIIFSCPSRSIWSWLRLDNNSESRTSSFTKFASDASLLSSWVPSEGVLSSEHRGESSFFPRIVNNVIRFKASPSSQEKWWPR
jgi:hypothetical protein